MLLMRPYLSDEKRELSDFEEDSQEIETYDPQTSITNEHGTATEIQNEDEVNNTES
jgi:hypothetical protein